MKSILAIAALALMVTACNEKKETKAAPAPAPEKKVAPKAVELSPADKAADEEAKKVENMEKELDALLKEI